MTEREVPVLRHCGETLAAAVVDTGQPGSGQRAPSHLPLRPQEHRVAVLPSDHSAGRWEH